MAPSGRLCVSLYKFSSGGFDTLCDGVIASPTLFCRRRLIIPEVFETVRRHLCVTHRMLDVLVA